MDAIVGTDAAESDAVATDVPSCVVGVDHDGDGLDDAQECALGTNPNASDTDGDGIRDDREVAYPAICVGTSVPQRRPPVRCATDADCMTGETCRGLDPRSPDTDGDTIGDHDEDPNTDGTIDPNLGETDPRLGDTDGDGHSDAMSGAMVCRTDGLAPIRSIELPTSGAQLAYSSEWGVPASVTGTNAGADLLDDAVAKVSGAVFSLAPSGDVRAEASRVESAIVTALGGGVTPVLLGRALTTHDLQPAVTSTYRIVHAGTSASALRDQLVQPLVGAPAPARLVDAGPSDEFLVDVTTILRTATQTHGSRTVALVSIAPRADFENAATVTAIRAGDLTNTTAIAESDRVTDVVCKPFTANPRPPVDFIWTVDTSGSMDVQQEKIGRVAAQFFDRLRAANVNFRAGVFQAGSGAVDLDHPGMRWVDGSDPNGATDMCEQVTSRACPTSPLETQTPYVISRTMESPVAAAIIAHNALMQRTMAGEPNAERRLSGGRVIAFFVTDEPTEASALDANDWIDYFRGGNDPQANLPWGGANYNINTLNNIVAYFQRNGILTYGMVPRYESRSCGFNDVRDIPRCVIEANGGASIPIGTATDDEVSAAFSRIVDVVAGGASEYVLTRSPITSTIRVRLRNADVPRSRVNGFDYDPGAHAIVFYGPMYRPATGDAVFVSYRAWGGSVG